MSSSFDVARAATNPYDYHQVISLSTKAINDALSHMYAIADINSPLKTYQKSVRGESIGAVFGAPRVQIFMNDQKGQHIFFWLPVLTGKLKVFVGDDQKEFPMDGWDLAFPVNIQSDELQPGNPQDVAFATQAGFTDEAFSISRLYLKLSESATTFEITKSKITGNITKSPDAMSGLADFMKRLVTTQAFSDATIVGYKVKAQIQGGDSQATFVPTSMQYVAYPWKGSALAANEDGDAKNCLNILSMTGFKPPPQTAALPFSGPFTETGVTLCLNRELFWGEWLLPEARELCKAVHIVVLEPTLKPSQDPKILCISGPNFQIGSDAPVEDYKWTPASPESGTGWDWAVGPVEHIQEGNYGQYHVTASNSARSSVNVTFSVNDSQIKITGFEKEVFNFAYANTDKKSDSALKATWEADFRIYACRDGGLAVSKATPTISPADPVIKSNITWNTDFTDWQLKLNNAFDTAITKKLGALTNALEVKLRERHRLFLPGGGIFLTREPRFNSRGDLLVSLEYNEFAAPLSDPTQTPFPSLHLAAVSPFGINSAPPNPGQVPHDKVVLPDQVHDHVLPPAWRVVPKSRNDFPDRQPLVPEKDLAHQVGQSLAPTVHVGA